MEKRDLALKMKTRFYYRSVDVAERRKRPERRNRVLRQIDAVSELSDVKIIDITKSQQRFLEVTIH